MSEDLVVRAEQPGDAAIIHTLNAAAFPSDAEARLVDALRAQAHGFISLVAEVDGDILGHIAFSPVTLDGRDVPIMGLAPMAVHPGRQRQGIGSALVRAGLTACCDAGAGAVVVLGHPDYYPRFGFRPASEFGLCCEYEVPDEAFMALELLEGALVGRSGLLHYHAAFAVL